MKTQKIKDKLLSQFREEFNIDNHFDSNTDETTLAFETTVGFEFQTDGKWSEAILEVVGTIYVKAGTDDYHNPIGYGASENQGESASIEEVEISSAKVQILGNVEDSFEFDYKPIYQVINDQF